MGYTTLEYLLDRGDVHDVITKLMFLIDTREYNKLAQEVFTEDIWVDYTSLFGGEPYTIPSKTQVERWKAFLGHIEKSSHVTTSILINLPRPENSLGGGPRPTKTSATANTVTTLVCKAVQGDPVVQSGGYYDFTLIRDPSKLSEGEGGENPWRISGMKANMAWIKGNMAVYQDPNLKDKRETE